MNRLTGTISSMRCEEGVTLLSVSCASHSLSVVAISDHRFNERFRPGDACVLIFNESETILANSNLAGISIRNRLPCTVTSVTKGSLLSSVNLDFCGTQLSSIVTTDAIDALEIKESNTVFALIKSTEIIIQGVSP